MRVDGEYVPFCGCGVHVYRIGAHSDHRSQVECMYQIMCILLYMYRGSKL